MVIFVTLQSLINYTIFVISFQFNLLVTQRLLCDNSDICLLASFWRHRFSTARVRKRSLPGTNHQEYNIPSQQERNPAILPQSNTPHHIPACSPWVQLLCIYFSPSHSWQFSNAITATFPTCPPLFRADYCPRPPFFCHAFGDLLIIHCLEHVKKSTGIRSVLGELPVGLYKGDVQVSALMQGTLGSCGVLQLTRRQQRCEIQGGRNTEKQRIQLG